MHFIAYKIDGKIYSEFVVENKDICYTVTDQKGGHLLSLQRISDGILDAAGKLEEYPEGHPEGHPLVGDELLGRMGIRITYFDNYNIFYYYDMQNDVVYIIRVLYNKADWQNILTR